MRRLVWRLRAPLALRPTSRAEEVWRLRWLLRRPPGLPGTLRFSGRTFHYRDGRPTWEQLNEIFLGRVYDLNCDRKDPRIIDCGAHVGLAIVRLRELFPAARITAYEADSQIAELMRHNLDAIGDDATEVIAAAAWTTNGEVSFKRTGSDNGHLAADGTDLVPARDLADHCRQRVDLLKLDVEGAEEQLIKHLVAVGAIAQIRAMVCEWHQWTPHSPRLHEILELLVANGFVYRLAAAGCLGDSSGPVFPAFAWPGNHIMVYAWRPAIGTPAR